MLRAIPNTTSNEEYTKCMEVQLNKPCRRGRLKSREEYYDRKGSWTMPLALNCWVQTILRNKSDFVQTKNVNGNYSMARRKKKKFGKLSKYRSKVDDGIIHLDI